MYRLQRPHTHLGVDLGAFHAGMAEHCLYPSQICAVLQHLGRHRMAEQVAAPFVYSRRFRQYPA